MKKENKMSFIATTVFLTILSFVVFTVETSAQEVNYRDFRDSHQNKMEFVYKIEGKPENKSCSLRHTIWNEYDKTVKSGRLVIIYYDSEGKKQEFKKDNIGQIRNSTPYSSVLPGVCKFEKAYIERLEFMN